MNCRRWFIDSSNLILMTACLLASSAVAAGPVFAPINTVGGIEFGTIRKGWLDPTSKFDDEVAKLLKKTSRDSGHSPSQAEQEMVRQMCLESRRWRFLVELRKETSYALYLLGVRMSDEVKLTFHGIGCLEFRVGLPGDQFITIRDSGVLCPHQCSPVHDWDDSRKTAAVLTTGSNAGRPEDWPNFVYVLLPRSLMGSQVLDVQPTSNMEIAGSGSPAAVR